MIQTWTIKTIWDFTHTTWFRRKKMDLGRNGSCIVTHDGDCIWITEESVDLGYDPTKSCNLITNSIITRTKLIICCQETWRNVERKVMNRSKKRNWRMEVKVFDTSVDGCHRGNKRRKRMKKRKKFWKGNIIGRVKEWNSRRDEIIEDLERDGDSLQGKHSFQWRKKGRWFEAWWSKESSPLMCTFHRKRARNEKQKEKRWWWRMRDEKGTKGAWKEPWILRIFYLWVFPIFLSNHTI